MKYIVFVSYETDAERKRVDYLLDKWSGRAKIKKPRGMVFIIDTEEANEFLEELLSKLSGNAAEKVEIYKIEEAVKKVEANVKTLHYTILEDTRVVGKFVEYLLSKLNATYSYSDALAKVYEVYTRKGRAIIKIIIRGNETSSVVFRIEGYGDAVGFLAERIDEEMKLFAGD
ncbi:hypothetical protein [Thermococcus sp.]